MTVDMSDFDKAVAEYSTKLDIAKKLRDKNVDISIIAETTNLPEAKIRDLK